MQRAQENLKMLESVHRKALRSRKHSKKTLGLFKQGKGRAKGVKKLERTTLSSSLWWVGQLVSN